MSQGWLEVSIDDWTAIVTFNRPPVNALDASVMQEFIRTFGELASRDDVRVAILTGGDKAFCAGVDMRLFENASPQPGDRAVLLSIHRAFFSSVREFAKPLIAAVNGPAVGAGFALAGNCDIMLAADDAFFSMPEVVVGQPSGAAFVTRMFSQSKGRRLFFTGEKISAREMMQLGLLEACVAREQLLCEATKIARAIAKNDPAVVRAAKQTCLMAAEVPYSVSKSLEYSVLEQLTPPRAV